MICPHCSGEIHPPEAEPVVIDEGALAEEFRADSERDREHRAEEAEADREAVVELERVRQEGETERTRIREEEETERVEIETEAETEQVEAVVEAAAEVEEAAAETPPAEVEETVEPAVEEEAGDGVTMVEVPTQHDDGTVTEHGQAAPVVRRGWTRRTTRRRR